MSKLPERGLTDQVPDAVQAMMRELNQQHGGRVHDRVLRLAVLGGIEVMPGGEALGGGDVILSEGAHRELTVYAPLELRFENFVDTLARKASQTNTVEVYMQINHVEARRQFIRQWMHALKLEVRAGRRSSLRGIHVRLFSRIGEDLWDGRL